MFRKLVFISTLLTSNFLFGQIGGQSIFQFLNAPHNARVGALGGSIVSLSGTGPSMVVNNPASLNEGMIKNIQFNEVFYAPGVKYSS